MSNGTAEVRSESSTDQLLAFLATDPDNLSLLADIAEAALAERRFDTAAEMLDRYARIAPLPPAQRNLAGMAAMQMGRFDEAGACFESLIAEGNDDGGLRFNLAWTRAMQKDLAGALEQLTDDTVSSLPQAATLQVQILHELGQFDGAAELARRYIELHPGYAPLMAAVSVLALDVDDTELAAHCAAKAPDHADALTTFGTLALGEEEVEQAIAHFDRALERNAGNPRAWVGRGLAELLGGRTEAAAADIDRGAEMFGSHVGSWIAAGWAHFAAQDLSASRARFETALQLDPNFAECHGSLAVLDLMEGDTAGARRRADIALRLDRQCASAALAHVMLASGAGDGEAARRIYERAVNMPLGVNGRTIAQSLTRLGMSRR